MIAKAASAAFLLCTMSQAGSFITLEGIDFSGKSTQAGYLVRWLAESGHDVEFIREPGGTEASERIRKILLSRDDISVCDRTELLLFLAARAQLVDEIITPKLDSGSIVVCDRFFDSTYAYQGYARGIDIEVIKQINDFATNGLSPDVTLVYDLPVEVAQRRGVNSAADHDRLEKEDVDFHNRVREGYLRLADEYKDRIVVINADNSLESIWERTREVVNERVLSK